MKPAKETLGKKWEEHVLNSVKISREEFKSIAESFFEGDFEGDPELFSGFRDHVWNHFNESTDDLVIELLVRVMVLQGHWNGDTTTDQIEEFLRKVEPIIFNPEPVGKGNACIIRTE